MGNLKIEYIGTLIFAAMSLTVGLSWALTLCIEGKRTKLPDLPPDFQQVKVFGGICICITLALAMKGW